MATWSTPFTQWVSRNYFNVFDYSRITGNIQYLRDLAVTLYGDFSITEMPDKSYTDFLYADEMNDIVNNLYTINENTYNDALYTFRTFEPNGSFCIWYELDEIEKITLSLYEKLTTQKSGLRNFEWNFGMKGGIF